MRDKNLLGFYTFGLVYFFAAFCLGNLLERHLSIQLLSCFSTLFIAYLFLLQKKDNWQVLFTLGVLSRLALFFSLPTLSDDVFRFIWDGTLLKNGIHPFAELPSNYLSHPVDRLTTELYYRLNSPNYFTIYPPLNQALFWLSVQFGDSWLLSTNIIRSFLLLADIGSFFLLRTILQSYQKDQNLALWYFLNPLVLLELTGNLHFEGLVVFFILAGIYGYKKSQSWAAISGFGFAVGTKLLPVIYLPFLFIRGLKDKKWWITIAAGIVGLLTLLPLLDETFISGMRSSLDLYFRKFEFNASLYFIAREIGFWKYGYNNIAKIGPLLSVISTLCILGYSTYAAIKRHELPSSLLVILCLYILFGTIIHPWYIIPLIAFGILSGYWFPILWSFMIFLTYLGYTESGFELPMWIVVLEYSSVAFCAILEFLMKRPK